MTKTKKQSKTRSTNAKKNSDKLVPYVSWSRMQAVESSERQYAELYVYGKKITSASMRFGTYVTDILEGKTTTKDPIMLALLDEIPRYTKGNHKIKTTIKIGKEEVEVLGIMDGWSARKKLVGEYKTSLKMWTKKQIEEHGQNQLYAWMVWKNKGYIPDIEITCMEVEKDDKNPRKLYLTGEHITHRYTPTVKQLLEIEVRVKKDYKKMKQAVLNEIEQCTTSKKKNPPRRTTKSKKVKSR